MQKQVGDVIVDYSEFLVASSSYDRFEPFYTASIRFAKLDERRCVEFPAPIHMAREPSEAPAHNFAEALQADASLGSFGELLRQVVDSPALSADASSDETPGFSNASHYSDSVQQSPQGLGGDVEALAQHAQQEAARFQLTEHKRRERNKAAQASYRQRKRVSLAVESNSPTEICIVITYHLLQAKVASDKQELQRAADRVVKLEQQIAELRSDRAALALEV